MKISAIFAHLSGKLTSDRDKLSYYPESVKDKVMQIVTRDPEIIAPISDLYWSALVSKSMRHQLVKAHKHTTNDRKSFCILYLTLMATASIAVAVQAMDEKKLKDGVRYCPLYPTNSEALI
ncbi:hypothetical protein ACTXT7_008855 [Hymenolepis weldensis]